METNTTEDEGQFSRRNALIAMGVIVVLLVGGIYLTQILHAVSQLQDCVMQGRRNCMMFH